MAVRIFIILFFAALLASVAHGADAPPDYERLKREHWAYQPIKAVAPPGVKDDAWVKGDVDRFILNTLEGAGLKPVGNAERAVLVRRVYFDLIGLPPTVEEIDGFVNDASADAYEKLVDRLLASPRFGERWGRHWLDVVRFAESVTLRGFVLPETWRFRDYVIESFNSDRPFNSMLMEHVAGDLMSAETVEQRRRQITATTFLAMGNTNLEEQDKQALRMDVVDEQLDTLGKAFLGQTIGCARCHDHKFDPIPAADYYAMAGILRNAKAMEHANVSKWISVPLPDEPAVEAELKKHEDAVASLQKRLDDARAAIAKAKTKDGDAPPRGGKGKAIAITSLPGVVIDDSAAKKVGDWAHSTSVKTYIGEGYVHDDDAGKGEKSLTFFPEFPKSGRYEVRLAYVPGGRRATNVPVSILSEDGERTIPVNQRTPPLIDGRFVSLGVFRFEKGSQAYVQVSNEGTDGHVVADAVQFLLADGDAKDSSLGESDPAQVEIRRLEKELKDLTTSGPKRQRIVSVVEEKEISDTQIHARGSVHTLGATVPRGFLSCVPVGKSASPSIPSDQSGRLQLGQWLADPQNPLPARVMANRAWHWLMGQGIVRTVDNFGTTGESPSHPQLLDYLAVKFVEDGWSLKKLVRRVVLSHAYQLADSSDNAALAADPENRLHWRMDRRRLDAECIRDAMLSASGRLDLKMGGQTYPADREFDYGYQYDDTRRSVYVPVFRNALPEVFEAFDFADPSSVVGKRNVSTVAPQALYILNHPFPRQQAQATADRILGKTELDDAGKLVWACRTILGRGPTDAEREVLSEFVKGSKDARAAWANVVHALFASSDFRYVN